MRDIIEFIEKDKRVNKLLAEFRVEFLEVYEGLSIKEKSIAINASEEIFRRWLHSPLVLETYFNPSYIINIIAQSYKSGQYVIKPNIKIEKTEDSKIMFITKYYYYSVENHPILEDIKILIDNINPVLTIGYEEVFEERFTKDLIKGLSFNSIYYQRFLLDILKRLNIISEMTAIGCKCYQLNNYKKFLSNKNKEKLTKIIDATVNIAKDNINNVNFINGAVEIEDIYCYLNNGITEEDYLNILERVEAENKKFISDMYTYSKLSIEPNLNYLEITESLEYNNIADYIIGHDLKREIDKTFTTTFGYYLGLLQVNYGKPFLMYEIIKGVCEARDDIESEFSIFDCDNLHDISKLGREVFSKKDTSLKEEVFLRFNENHIDAAINTRKIQRTNLLKEFKKQKKQYLMKLKN